MELKSLFLGILFSVGVFAVKSGVGLFYFLSHPRGRLQNTGFLLIFAGIYLIAFYLIFLLLSTIDILRYFNLAQTFFSSGMLIHLAMAALLMIWGIILLKSTPQAHGGLGWLPMVIPCPVCLTVILFSVAFTMSTLPERGVWSALLIYGIYIGISLFTAVILKLGARHWVVPKETVLGAIMVLMSAYFLLSITVLPQMSELDKVYRLAAYHGELVVIHNDNRAVVGLIALVGMLLGFVYRKNKIRKELDWISEPF